MSSSSLMVPPALAQVLQPHQLAALHFLWRRLVDEGLLRMAARSQATTVEQRVLLFQEVYGCVLGHSMGLGKTLTTLSFLLLLQGQVLLMTLRREQQLQRQQQQQTSHKQPHKSRRGAAAAATARLLSSSSSLHANATAVAYCESVRVLVLCPRSCVTHWRASAAEWVRASLFGRVTLDVHVPSAMTSARAAERVLATYYRDGGLLVVGYEEYVKYIRQAKKTTPATTTTTSSSPVCNRVASMLDHIRQPLPGPPTVTLLDILESADVVVVDEAHRLRRGSSLLVRVLMRHLRRVQLRVALTGTPLQNHLEEYNTMQSLVTGNDLDAAQFARFFVTPIARGQCADSSLAQFAEMQRCVSALRRYFASAVHYCGADVLAQSLPPRHELLFVLRLTPAQEASYRALLARHAQARAARREQPAQTLTSMLANAAATATATGRHRSSAMAALMLHHETSHICCHPCLATMHATAAPTPQQQQQHDTTTTAAVRRRRGAAHKGQQQQQRDDDDDDDANALCRGVDNDKDSDDEDMASLGAVPAVATASAAASSHGSSEDEGDAWAAVDVCASAKLHFALALVQHITRVQHEKVVVFARYRSHLALLAALLRRHVGLHARIFDGTCSGAERARCVDALAHDADTVALLCTVQAGGLGINLTAANHCILLDVSWNPSHDTQATYRVYRYGQTRPTYVYRLATHGTSEQVVFAYALQKAWLHRKVADVADPARQERHRAHSYFVYPCAVPLREAEDEDEDKNKNNNNNNNNNNSSSNKNNNNNRDKDDAATRRRAREAHWLQLCATHCPAAAAVLPSAQHLCHGTPLLSSVEAVVLHISLLRDDTNEVITAMSRRFEAVQKGARRHVPVALGLAAPSALLPTTAAAMAATMQQQTQQQQQQQLARCEAALVDAMQQAAHQLILAALSAREQQQQQQQQQQNKNDSSHHHHEDDEAAVVRQMDKTLAMLLQRIVHTYTDDKDNRNDDATRQTMAAAATHASSLAEVLLRCYHAGVRSLLRVTLDTVAYVPLRTYLLSRIPLPSRHSSGHYCYNDNNNNNNNSAVSSYSYSNSRHAYTSSAVHTTAASTTRTQHNLQEELLYRPFRLLHGVDAVEQTYVCTELGLVRPLVPQCLLNGVRQCCAVVQTTTTTAAATATARAHNNDNDNNSTDDSDALHQLLMLFDAYAHTSSSSSSDASSEDDTTTSRSDDSDSDSDSDVAHDNNAATLTRAVHRRGGGDVVAVRRRVCRALVACLSELWPACGGLRLPAPPRLPTSLAAEEQLMRRVYATAARPRVGLFHVREAAQLLQLPRHARQRDAYTCPRCRGACLRRTVQSALQCLRCRYHADFELRSSTARQHACILYQLAYTCNSLDAFATARSLRGDSGSGTHNGAAAAAAAGNDNDNDDDVRSVLARLRGSHPVYGFVARCMRAGAEALLRELPLCVARRLLLQCGVRERHAARARKSRRYSRAYSDDDDDDEDDDAADDESSYSSTSNNNTTTSLSPATLAHMQRLLLANATVVWQSSVRRHVRDAVAAAFRARMQPSRLTTLTSMPLMLLLLALRDAIRRTGVQYAHELIADNATTRATLTTSTSTTTMYTHDTHNGDSDSSDNNNENSHNTLAASPQHTLLRFAADGLVKLLYTEKLVQPSPPTTATTTTTTQQQQQQEQQQQQQRRRRAASSVSASSRAKSVTTAASQSPSLSLDDDDDEDGVVYTHGHADNSGRQQQQQQHGSRTSPSPQRVGGVVTHKRARRAASLTSSRRRHGSRPHRRHRSRSRRSRCGSRSNSDDGGEYSNSSNSSDSTRSGASSMHSCYSRHDTRAARGGNTNEQYNNNNNNTVTYDEDDDDDDDDVRSTVSTQLYRRYRQLYNDDVDDKTQSNQDTDVAADKNDDDDDDDDVVGNSSHSNSSDEEDDASAAAARRAAADAAQLRQRTVLYWLAFCEVYGTHRAELLRLYVEDDEDNNDGGGGGATLLPPPPTHVWLTKLTHATRDGQRIVDVVDAFVEKVLALSQHVRLIR